MKERHFKEIFGLFDITEIEKSFDFNRLVQLGIEDKKELIDEISVRASGEALIENQIANINKKWSELNFNFEDDGDFFQIVKCDDILSNIDDHLVSI